MPLSIPVGHIHGAVRAKIDGAGHHPKKKDVLVHHLEVGALWLGLECRHFLDRKFAEKKGALVAIIQRCAGIVLETSRPDGEFAHGGSDIRGLPLPVRKPKFFIDPGAIFRGLGLARPAPFLELPVESPTGIAAFRDVNEPLPLLPDVSIVVHREQVSKFVKSQFLDISQPGRKHLQVAAVPITPQHPSRVGVVKKLALAGADGKTVVADREIQIAVRPDGESMQVVSIKGGMNPESMNENLPLVCVPVVVRVVQLPDIRINGRKDIAAIGKHTGHDTVDLLVEPLGKHFGDIRLAVVVRVLKQMDPLLDSHQVTPVVGTVLIPVLKPGFVLFAEFRGHFTPKHFSQLGNVLIRKIVNHPFLVGPDINVHGPPPGRLNDKQPPLIVKAKRDWIQ